MSDARRSFEGFSLLTVAQMAGIERLTCRLWVESDGRRGVLDFLDGDLVDAETDELRGLDAAHEIMRWRHTALEIDTTDVLRPRTIERPLMEILIDSARIADESRGVPLPELDFEPEEVHMDRISQVLEKFRDEVPEFVSTDIVNIESGLSIGGSSVNFDFDASVASASYAEVVKSNARALDLLGLGAESTEDILISTASVYLLIRLLGAEYYQILAISRKGNLGLARAIMKKLQPGLLDAVQELV